VAFVVASGLTKHVFVSRECLADFVDAHRHHIFVCHAAAEQWRAIEAFLRVSESFVLPRWSPQQA
jgi:hypothetical protein